MLCAVKRTETCIKCLLDEVFFPISSQVVIRRLPPSLTEDQLKEELGNLPEHDFFYFVGSDMRHVKFDSLLFSFSSAV